MTTQESFSTELGDKDMTLDTFLRTLTSVSTKPVEIKITLNKEVPVVSPAEQTVAEPVQPSLPAVNPVIEQLLPIFWDDKEAATAFFLDINKESPLQITRRINALVKEGKMNQKLCKQVLWTVLHQAQIYPYSFQNWCKQIN